MPLVAKQFPSITQACVNYIIGLTKITLPTQDYVTNIYLLFRFKFKQLQLVFNQFKQNVQFLRVLVDK